MKKLAISTLYKEQGIVSATPGVSFGLPPELLAMRISGRKDLMKTFAIDPLSLIVDGRISDKAFRVRALIAACSWDGPCPLAYDEIAMAVDTSRVRAIQHVKRLEKLGLITVKRARNSRNYYAVIAVEPVKNLTGTEVLPPTPKSEEAKATLLCPKCNRKRPMLLRSGICRHCNWELNLRRLVREEIARTA